VPLPTGEDLVELNGQLFASIGKCRDRLPNVRQKIEAQFAQLHQLEKNTDLDFKLLESHIAEIDKPSLKSRLEEIGGKLEIIEQARNQVRDRLLKSSDGKPMTFVPADACKEAKQELGRLLSDCDEIEGYLFAPSEELQGVDGEARSWVESEIQDFFGELTNRHPFYDLYQGKRVATEEELTHWLGIWKEIQRAYRVRNRADIKVLYSRMNDDFWVVTNKSPSWAKGNLASKRAITNENKLGDKPKTNAKWNEIQGKLGPSGGINPENVQEIAQLLHEFSWLYAEEGGVSSFTRQQTVLPALIGDLDTVSGDTNNSKEA
jgi:hypothetical protein